MPYVKRTAGVVTGLFRRLQPGIADEFLEDSDAEVMAFRNPPPPSDDERINRAFEQTQDRDKVLFEAIFELVNDVRVLKGQNEITKAQLKDWMKAKLP